MYCWPETVAGPLTVMYGATAMGMAWVSEFLGVALSVTVKFTEKFPAAVGVPLMRRVVALNVSPVGRPVAL